MAGQGPDLGGRARGGAGSARHRPRRRPRTGAAPGDHRVAALPRHRRQQRQRVRPGEGRCSPRPSRCTREDNDDEGESTVVIQLATVLYNEGRFAEAREKLERALPIVVASGLPLSRGGRRQQPGGDRRPARRAGPRPSTDQPGSRAVHRPRRPRRHRHGATTSSARSTAGSATCEAPKRSFRTALDTTLHHGFDIVTSDSLLSLALICSAQGRHDEALATSPRRSTVAGRRDSPMAVARALVGRGYVQLAAGQADDASESLHAGLDASPATLGLDTSSSKRRPPWPVAHAAAAAIATRRRQFAERVLGDARSPGSARRDPALRDLPVVLAGPRRLR